MPLMRILRVAPRAFVDPSTGAPAFGSYSGPLPRVDLDAALGASPIRARARSMFRRKKWVWLAVSTDEVWLSLAVVRMGYAASAFAFVFDLRSRRMLVDRALVAPPFAAAVDDDPHASGELARFGFGRSRIVLERQGSTLQLRGRLTDLEIDTTLDESEAPPAIAAIAALSSASPSSSTAISASISATEKRALANVRGSLVAAGQRFALDSAVGGYDYTHGLMPRHTRWKWAFAMGRTVSGEPVAFNVVQGFVGEDECAAFLRDAVLPLREPHFDFDVAHPMKPWSLTTRDKDINLTFDVGAVHAQYTNLGLARSRFLQPVGTFRGTMTLGGEELTLDGVPGVVEDQDVLW
jgi:hypothetical protein